MKVLKNTKTNESELLYKESFHFSSGRVSYIKTLLQIYNILKRKTKSFLQSPLYITEENNSKYDNRNLTIEYDNGCALFKLLSPNTFSSMTQDKAK